MRLDFSVLLTSLAALSAADTMDTETHCSAFFGTPIKCSSAGDFVTDYGKYHVDANEGCRGGSTSVPGLTQLCVDWDKKRAHFQFIHQEYKRCMRQRYSRVEICGGGYHSTCAYDHWEEVPCSWREEVEDKNVTISAAG